MPISHFREIAPSQGAIIFFILFYLFFLSELIDKILVENEKKVIIKVIKIDDIIKLILNLLNKLNKVTDKIDIKINI